MRVRRFLGAIVGISCGVLVFIALGFLVKAVDMWMTYTNSNFSPHVGMVLFFGVVFGFPLMTGGAVLGYLHAKDKEGGK